jgi:hypothetical protein
MFFSQWTLQFVFTRTMFLSGVPDDAIAEKEKARKIR